MKRLLPILLLVFSVGVGAETIRIYGGTYVGDVSDGVPHGNGTWTDPSGGKYVGDWKDGKEHGQGTYTYKNGDKYVGEFKDGKEHGQGTYTWTDGKKYVGEYKDGKAHGQGTYTYGKGKFKGEQYVGEYKYGYKWQGAKYNAAGEVIERWLDGISAPACNGNRKGRSWGTGFAVNQHHVVTSAHVIPCCKKVTVYSLPSCSNAEVVTIVATEQKNDLGLLRLDRPLKHYATLRSGKELQLGEAVSTYDRKPKVNGCPQYDVGQGNVTELNWMPNDSRIMVHDSPTHKGSSGGPVLDASGHIVGVTRAVIVNTVTNRQRSAAVKSHLLKAFLKSNNVEYKTAPSIEKLGLSEIKKKSDKFTVQIKCLQ